MSASTDPPADAPLDTAPTGIESFIVRTPGLAALIDDVIDNGMPFFPRAAVTVDYLIDPQDGHESAVLRFCSDHTPLEAHGRLQLFDRAWWLDNCNRADHRLIVDVGFTEEGDDDAK